MFSGVHILDGGLGSELETLGLNFEVSYELMIYYYCIVLKLFFNCPTLGFNQIIKI